MIASIKRGMSRILTLLGIGFAFSLPAHLVPELLGATAAPMFFTLGLTFFGLAVGGLALRILQPKIDAQEAAALAMKANRTSAGLVYLGHCVLAGIILLLIVSAGRA